MQPYTMTLSNQANDSQCLAASTPAAPSTRAFSIGSPFNVFALPREDEAGKIGGSVQPWPPGRRTQGW